HAHGRLVLETRAVSEQIGRFAGPRKFGRAAEPSVFGIVIAFELSRRVVEQSGAQDQLVGGVLGVVGFQALVQVGRGMEDVIVTGFPKLANVLEKLPETRATITGIGREVRSPIERFKFWRQEDIERPAALSAYCLDE